LCAELKVQQEESLSNNEKPLSEYSTFQKAVRFADVEYRTKLNGYNKPTQERFLGLAEIRKKIAKYKNCISGDIVGLKTDGTVVAVGNNKVGQCNTVSWRDIVAVAAGGGNTVGLKADGTVVTVGDNKNGQCNTENWRDIVAIAACDGDTVGLKADGTVAVVGYNAYGQCNTGSWRDIGPVPEELVCKWRGICKYCGGKLGGVFTKKCKDCGREN
jgi:alpha-tubulin suppressor-like RCC1 family protein